MPLETEKIYVPTPSEVSQTWRENYRLAALQQGVDVPPIQPNTTEHLDSVSAGHLAASLYSNVSIHDQARDVYNAPDEDLDDMLRQRGLPQVPSSPASGKVSVTVFGVGTVALSQGQLLAMPDGTHAFVALEYAAVSDQGEIEVTTTGVGDAQNLQSGTLRWVQSPLNVAEKCPIVVPFTGGRDEESPRRKRTRIINDLENRPGGGNWAQHVALALDTSPTLDNAFCYSALGGAGQLKVVLVNPLDTTLHVYTREVDATTIASVAAAYESEMTEVGYRVVDSAASLPSDHAIQVDIPAGGSPAGWVNGIPWPSLVSADNGRVTVTSVTDASTFQIGANSSVAPVAGTTRIDWWDAATMSFVRARIDSVAGSAGAWDVSTDVALTGIAVGDFVSPASNHSSEYGGSFIAGMGRLGPSEQTSSAALLSDSYRRPTTASGWPSDVTFDVLRVIDDGSEEIENIDFSYNSATSPAVPASIDTPPNILVPRQFGVYPL